MLRITDTWKRKSLSFRHGEHVAQRLTVPLDLRERRLVGAERLLVIQCSRGIVDLDEDALDAVRALDGARQGVPSQAPCHRLGVRRCSASCARMEWMASSTRCAVSCRTGHLARSVLITHQEFVTQHRRPVYRLLLRGR
jgi:hypothetical protein